MTRPLVPRGWKETQAIHTAKKGAYSFHSPLRGKAIPVFNGSLTSRKNKKRPITLPKINT